MSNYRHKVTGDTIGANPDSTLEALLEGDDNWEKVSGDGSGNRRGRRSSPRKTADNGGDDEGDSAS